jgi:hypothetical protein
MNGPPPGECRAHKKRRTRNNGLEIHCCECGAFYFEIFRKGSGEMPEEITPAPEMGATPAEPTPAPQQTAQPAAIAGTRSAEEIAAELERTRAALKEANKADASKRKRLEELEAAEAERQKAAMTDAERTQARIKELEELSAHQAQLLKQKELQDLQREIAAEIGLPSKLAGKIAGANREEMIADAQAMLEVLPKQEPAKPAPPKLEATNPGNGEQGETRAQKKGRILGTRTNAWDSSGAQDRGCGIFISE